MAKTKNIEPAKSEKYSDLLKDPRWQKKRLEIMKRDNFSCVLCHDDKTSLNVHHTIYISGLNPWDYDNYCLKTICNDCHYEIHKRTYLKHIAFDNVSILKFKLPDSRVMIVSFDEYMYYSSYDLDVLKYFSQFSPNAIDKLTMFINSIKKNTQNG